MANAFKAVTTFAAEIHDVMYRNGGRKVTVAGLPRYKRIVLRCGIVRRAVLHHRPTTTCVSTGRVRIAGVASMPSVPALFERSPNSG